MRLAVAWSRDLRQCYSPDLTKHRMGALPVREAAPRDPDLDKEEKGAN